uniref:Uncharacterized protein n=1 Tax=Vespula pensylvanica TaxID=30213 RepID=A0A834NXY8_VESPE|nr:hypothetical protein H0235_010551 [Vespula pensylvanica]
MSSSVSAPMAVESRSGNELAVLPRGRIENGELLLDTSSNVAAVSSSRDGRLLIYGSRSHCQGTSHLFSVLRAKEFSKDLDRTEYNLEFYPAEGQRVGNTFLSTERRKTDLGSRL